MSRILSVGDERGGLSDERALSGGKNDGISLSALAASGVVADIGNVLLDGEGLSGHGGLIDSDESVATVWKTLLLIIRGSSELATDETLGAHLSLVVGETVLLVVVGADKTAVTWDDGTMTTTLKNNL
jgi:hypothetical protein